MKTHTQKTVLATVLLMASAASLSGCINLGSKPPNSLLSLSAQSNMPAGADQVSTAKETLVIHEPYTPQAINVNRVAVLTVDNSYAYLKKAAWVDRPARMFQNLLVETIAARNNRVVMRDFEGIKLSPERLRGRLVRFYYDAASGQAQVAFDGMRINKQGQIEVRRFTSAETVAEVKPEQVAQAMNDAANKVAIEVSEWIG